MEGLHRAGKARILDSMKRIGVVFILVLAFAGLADSAYLAEHEINGTPLICNIENLNGCNIVANSSYSQLFGVPLAEYGVLFYGILFVLAALELVLFDQLLRRVIQGAAIIGVLSSLYFTTLQIFFIGAFCIYCGVSAAITLIIFILASFIEPIRKRARDISSTPLPPPGLSMPPAA